MGRAYYEKSADSLSELQADYIDHIQTGTPGDREREFRAALIREAEAS
jgi:hypothetical protein